MSLGNAPDEEHEDPHGECAAEIARLKARVKTLETALKDFVGTASKEIIFHGAGATRAYVDAETRARKAMEWK